MMNNAVLVEINPQGVATVCLNRADKHNAFDDDMIATLSEAFASLAKNGDVRAVVLRSEGKSFSAGADLNWMKRMASYSREENLRDAKALAEMLKRLNNLPMPTIARVQGAAFGGAVGLVACCDVAIATERASFCLSEVKIGLTPATISPYVVAAIGPRASRRFFISAERFSAAKAEQLGLVSEICDAADLDERIAELLNTLLANSPIAMAQAKQLVRDVAHQTIDDELIFDTCERIANIRVSSEGQEGLSAFLEKRSPAWIKE